MLFFRKIQYLIGSLLFLFLLCGCDETDILDGSESFSKPDISSSAPFSSLTYEMQLSDQQLQSVNISDILGVNCSFGCMTSAEHYIYYEACETDSNTSNYLKTTIYRLDIDTQCSESLFIIENGGQPFFTNELCCIGDTLFWVYRDVNTLKISFYDTSTEQQGTLKEYPPATIDLILSGDNRFLSWFLPCESGISLHCFDTLSQTDICLSNRVSPDSPYTRAYINNGIIAYLENIYDGRLLVIYNLLEKREEYSCVLPKDFLLTRLQANSRFAICTDGYSRDSAVFLLNREKQEFEKITLSDTDCHIFSCHLYDSNIFLVSNLSRQLLTLSIDSGCFSIETFDVNVIQTAISPDGIFYGCNPVDKVIFFLK